jgi:hypothetical protein
LRIRQWQRASARSSRMCRPDKEWHFLKRVCSGAFPEHHLAIALGVRHVPSSLLRALMVKTGKLLNSIRYVTPYSFRNAIIITKEDARWQKPPARSAKARLVAAASLPGEFGSLLKQIGSLLCRVGNWFHNNLIYPRIFGAKSIFFPAFPVLQGKTDSSRRASEGNPGAAGLVLGRIFYQACPAMQRRSRSLLSVDHTSSIV